MLSGSFHLKPTKSESLLAGDQKTGSPVWGGAAWWIASVSGVAPLLNRVVLVFQMYFFLVLKGILSSLEWRSGASSGAQYLI